MYYEHFVTINVVVKIYTDMENLLKTLESFLGLPQGFSTVSALLLCLEIKNVPCHSALMSLQCFNSISVRL